MCGSGNTNLRFNAEHGTVLTEFIICAPFLFVMLMGIVDLGVSLNRQLAVNRIVYEAARFAASVPEVAAGSALSAAQASALSGHTSIRNRVSTLLVRNGINLATLSADYLTTEGICAASLGTSRDQVRVTLKIPFQTNFNLLKDLLPTLSEQVSGPYLFPRLQNCP